jgi:tetratricopeptide (TPR) repeat protein
MVANPADDARSRGRGRWNQWLDGLLALLVLVLAFLAASFVARNSDFWFHLATGRLLAQRQFSFGVDPFCYTTQQVYWTNHAWLFDLLLYALYDWIGGAALVLLKALLVTALAGLLLCLRRRNGVSWVPVICTALVVLAISPRLLLQPACVSYFFLALSFWLLANPHTVENGVRGTKYYLLLPVLFALWVNVDEWFLLGPVLAALFCAGERLQGQRRTPGWVVPVGLVACLLNPHTYHAFTLPAELSPVTWTSGLRQDVRFQQIFASPWQTNTYLQSTVYRNAAALAYFALTALGLVSFLLRWRTLLGWRFLVWISFGSLAAWQMRTIPFFAVVAGPITALNWQDILQSGVSKAESGKKSPMVFHSACRILTCLLLLGLIFLAWPGWLQGYGREGRHVAWDVQADSSLQKTGETLYSWRSLSKLSKDEHVFALHPEVAHYSAWFCRGEKHFFDHRYPLFPQAAQEYEEVCAAFIPDLFPKKWDGSRSKAANDWRQVLGENHVSVLIVDDPDSQRVFAAEDHLIDGSDRWLRLHVAGRALIFGWKEARPPGSFAELAFDANRLAYGPQDKKQQRELLPAPERGPGRGPQTRDFWTRYAKPVPPTSWESDAAMAYLRYSDEIDARQRLSRLLRSRSRYVAGLVGLPGLPASPQAIAVPLAFRFAYQPLFVMDAAERAPAPLLLAVRAARRALAVNPDDDNAYLRLGMAYMLLRGVTNERSAQSLLPPLAEVRFVQIVTALHQALLRNPDLEVAHQILGNLYLERQFLDAALEHRREELRLSRRSGRRPGEEPSDLARRLKQLEKAVEDLEKVVLDQKSEFVLRSRALHGDPVRLARLALQMGLARQALDDTLLPAQVVLLGSDGIKMELELLLLLGRAEEMRTSLRGEELQASKGKLGIHDLASPLPGAKVPLYHLPSYEWLLALQSAATGDYGVATASLGAIRSQMRETSKQLESLRSRLERLRSVVPQLLVSELGLRAQPQLPLAATLVKGRRNEALAVLVNDQSALAMEPVLRAQQADLLVVEGMLALEQGSPDTALQAFTDAQKLCPLSMDKPVEFAGWPIALSYLRRIQTVKP